MMISQKKDLVGNLVNGWVLLEEVDREFPDDWSAQRKHNARIFRAKNQKTDEEITTTISCIRNRRDGVNRRVSAKEYSVGDILGHYKVLKIIETMALYEVVDQRTNEICLKKRQNLLNHMNYLRHPGRKFHYVRGRDSKFEDRQIYSTWQNTKQSCMNPNHRQYPNFGGRGLSMCPEWASNFKKFREDIISEVGYKKSSRSMLWVIDEPVFKPGNVRWIERSRMNQKITDQIEAMETND